MLDIVICGEDTVSNEWLNSIIEEYLLSNQFDFRISIFINKKDLYKRIERGFRFHIILIDILLPDTNGIGLSRMIRRYDKNCIIILISVSAAYAILGYSVHAFDYIVKPLQRNRVIKAIAEALGKCGGQLNETVSIRVKGTEVIVKCPNIIYVESVKHYLRFHMINGEQHPVYGKLDEYEEALRANGAFLRCHQSFLVNMNHVKGICGRDFIMSDDTKIPMRKSSAAKLKKEYNKYVIERQF